MLEQIYWTPDYLGMKSIPQRFWQKEQGRVSVPDDMVNFKGPLYRRVTTAKTFPEFANRQEELFNHIFDFTFGILDERGARQVFSSTCGKEASSPLYSLGADFGKQIGDPSLRDFSQPDGFFVAEDWVLGVEIKFNASTSLDQIAKYILAFATEYAFSQQSKKYSLLYISPRPEKLLTEHLEKCGGQFVCPGFEVLLNGAKNSIKGRLEEKKTPIHYVLSNLQIVSISWQDFALALQSYLERYCGTDVPNLTHQKLVQGLIHEIFKHPHSGILSSRMGNAT
ncbi:hypothetical protein [Shimia sp.]|uniref:hypothetical protein n=1 Tax=Shimia sp. TaxID=1954381 RepID=UPI00329930F9